jgi:hypothetical protein
MGDGELRIEDGGSRIEDQRLTEGVETLVFFSVLHAKITYPA